MTARDVLEIVRHQLADLEAGNYRWADALLLSYLEAGQRLTLRRRPELWLDDSGDVITTSSNVTTLEAEMVLPAEWLQALAEYVVFRALAQDSSDQANLQRAAMAKSEWETVIANG